MCIIINLKIPGPWDGYTVTSDTGHMGREGGKRKGGVGGAMLPLPSMDTST